MNSINENATPGEKQQTLPIYKDATPGETEAAPPSPITFSSMGIPSIHKETETPVGKLRPCKEITYLELAYMMLMLISLSSVLIFTIVRLTNVDRSEPDFTFCLTLLVQVVFCTFYLFDGVLRERPSEIFVLSIASVLVTIYVLLNYLLGIQTDIKLIRMIVACVLAPFEFGLGLYIARQYYLSRKLIMRTVGGVDKFQTMMQRVLIFEDVLKLDLQLAVSLVTLILVSGASLTTRDIVVLAVLGPINIIWFLLGLYAIPKESRPLSWVFAVFSLVQVGYIIYRFACINTFIHDSRGFASATIVCCVVALVVRAALMTIFTIVFRSFGNGLLEQIESQRETLTTNRIGASTVTHQISINKESTQDA